MIGRAGWTRKPLKERKVEIYNAVGLQTVDTGNFATVHSIARALGMMPSTHLYKLCRQMATDNEIDMICNPDDRPVYKFYLSIERVEKMKHLCEFPQACNPSAPDTLGVCKDKDGKWCLMMFMYNE